MADGPRFKHVEAYCLMRYVVVSTGEEEILWNSRDGVTPFFMTSRNGDEARHRSTRERPDRRAIDHVPAVGDRIFVDMTEARARALIAEALACERSTPEGLAVLEKLYASPEEAFERMLKTTLDEIALGKPDVLVVTAGYIESLEERRRDAAAERTRDAVILTDPAKRSRHYDRKGQPIDFMEWARLTEDGGLEYKRVARTHVGSDMFVSTVWLGLDHNFSFVGPPLIFETMVFRRVANPTRDAFGRLHEWDGDEQERWSTEAEALVGHERIVAEQLALLAKKSN